MDPRSGPGPSVSPDTPMDADSIPGRTAAAFERLDALDNYISRMEHRLSEVTIPTDVPPDGTVEAVRQQRSSHGELIQVIGDRIGGAGQRLSRLLDHLDT